jgi:hypothetical protein
LDSDFFLNKEKAILFILHLENKNKKQFKGKTKKILYHHFTELWTQYINKCKIMKKYLLELQYATELSSQILELNLHRAE